MKRLQPIHYLLAAPVHVLLLLFLGLPSIYVFWLSLNQSTYGSGLSFVGLANYAAVLTDPYFWRAFVNTLIVVNSVVYAELLIALGMALLFVGGVPFKRLTIAIVLAPYAVSEVIAVVMWRFMMEPSVGIVTRSLESIGLPALQWSFAPGDGLVLVSMISVWLHLPFTFVILYSALLAIPAELYEAARIDGASKWAEFQYVTVPLLMPAILLAIIFRYIYALRIFSEVWLLTQGGPARLTEVVAVYLYQQAFRYGDFGGAAATGWLMVVASILLASYYLRQLNKRTFQSNA